MLIEFRVENHRSIRDEQGLTLEAGPVDGDTTRLRAVDGRQLLPAAALYGANASGKSNVLAALRFMRDAVANSHSFWQLDGGVPREPFAWGRMRREMSLFQTQFLIDDVRYEYGFVVDDVRIREEWLKAWPHGRPQVWFERDSPGRPMKFGEHLRGENRAVELLTRENALFLSAAAQLNHEQLAPIFRWFQGMHSVGVRSRNPSILVEKPVRWFAGDASPTFGEGGKGAERIAGFRDLLRAADIGIIDLEVTDGNDGRGRRVLVRHQARTEDAWLPLEEESHGTQRLFSLAPLVFHALAEGAVLLVDELEAGLHPLLALEIVRAFHDPKRNPKGAQLIFTTHDTNLLGSLVGEPALRRDQVWLTEKDDDGGTRFYPMTDYKPRKMENLERGYLQGRYGAIPFLGVLPWGDAPVEPPRPAIAATPPRKKAKKR